MADSTFWWLAAGVFVAAELLSGTFYLLMITTGLVAAALAAHAGLGMSWQWIVAALVGGGSVLVLRGVKKSRPASAPARANRDVNLDVGETVQVTRFEPDGSCSVFYRGARWDASLMPGELASPGAYRIAEVIGSRLILKKNHNV